MNTKIIVHLKKYFTGLQAVYLFGSVAKGMATTKSDVDIAFLCTNKVSNLTRWKVAEDLARLLNRDVDLVDLSRATEVMRMEVVSSAQRIYVKDEDVVEAFEDKVYMLYIDLNENRAAILADIASRGSVY